MFLLALLCLPAVPVTAQTVSVNSNYIEIDGDTATGIFGLGTSSTYSTLPLASLTYDYQGPSYTSTITPWINGTAYDFADAITTSPMVSSGSGLGAYIETTKSIADNVLLTAHYEIVNNPETGTPADTAMMKFTFQNTGSGPVTIGLRLQIDTMVNGNDGANISINNGTSTIPSNTLYTNNANNIPPEWWDYDIPPQMGTPNLVGHGAVYNNPYDAPATKPDAMEVAAWPDVMGSGNWNIGPIGDTISDSSVVLWWTGTGDASHGNIVLNPGQSITYITYYGLCQIALLTTPTWTPTMNTPTPTPTITPTFPLAH